MKKIIAFTISAILLFSLVLPASATDRVPTGKEEVVYGILGLDGGVKSVYVVNIFNSGSIVDYGDYSKVENLTDADAITQNGDEISVNSAADRFYYQGTPKVLELPWDIAISYTLDGVPIAASELSGASGALSMHVQVTQNPNTDKIFYDNYALQIALTLSTTLCNNIQADGATIAEAGADKQLSYIVLPGTGADFTVSADVHDFEMAAMTFNGIKLVLDMDIDNTQFAGQFTELTTAISGLDDGAQKLLVGAGALKDGMSQYLTGLATYKNGLASLSSGASDIASGIAALDGGLKNLSAQGSTLAAGARSMQQAAFASANAQLSGLGLPELTTDNYSAILSSYPDFAAVKTQLDQVVQYTQGISAYTGAVSKLAAGTESLSSGSAALSSSLSQVSVGAQNLYDGAEQMNAAISALKDGLATYKNGTADLRNGTKDMDSKVAGQIDQLLAQISGGSEVKSFVSDKNTNISAVQFVIKTDAVTIAKADNSAAPEEEQQSFWDKFLALFSSK